ncbi:DUF6473 family protein [Pseudotabrizicola alkalilacus]|uniref:DUF6473 domain-containing protein n=1 Tax=Pseudotabrizicola alkalilacus TaxID=2305252 RepID=A0A411Z5H0_9RHOB|nr:DUF6473 family protein [Pseudotabrizicola alkalilacus]RGP38304.1 hypothetical protein D1012_05625 [Pseudotabrizicola alkalilacus]
MAFEYPGDGSLDYYPCRYGMSRVLFRGPRRDLDRPYVVTLGGTETYGKFVPEPYPALIEAATGLRMVNLGYVNAGLDLYLKDSAVLETASRARLAVVQIVGAQNLTNRFYSVHARRNDRFLRASSYLRNIYREVDFTEFSFTRHMLSTLQAVSENRFEVLAEELRAAWVTRMKTLITSLPCKTVLLWVANTPPPSPGRRSDLTHDPLLVDAEMVAVLRAQVTCYVEVVASPDALLRGTSGMAYAPFDAPAAQGLPGPAVHRQIADQLGPELQRLF